MQSPHFHPARLALPCLLTCLLAPALLAHDPITTKLTWSREISRLLAARCLSCHQTGGAAPFPLTSYEEARPWAVAIREEVAARRMPPWNPVRGFGRFASDPSLSQEEIQPIVEWVNGGAPEGDPRLLDSSLPRLASPASAPPGTPIPARDGTALSPGTLSGLRIRSLPTSAPVRILLQSPAGAFRPLAWLQASSPHAPSLYTFAEPVSVTPGSILRLWGPPDSRLELYFSPSPNPPAKLE